jgi:hypothetical protein
MGLKFDYPPEFEALWQAHPVGVKKLGYDAWRKLKLDADENAELLAHLKQRHRDDEKWLAGTYVPHLSTFLNGRRWEDEYKKIRVRESSGPPIEIWARMGYASFDDYCRGVRRG